MFRQEIDESFAPGALVRFGMEVDAREAVAELQGLGIVGKRCIALSPVSTEIEGSSLRVSIALSRTVSFGPRPLRRIGSYMTP
jgi:hypothetical protein